MTEKDWIAQMVAPAQKASEIFGYPVSVLVAQSCQENGYGSDPDCEVLTEAHNVLGMKEDLLNDTWISDYWNGDSIYKKTPEWYGGKLTYIYDYFRKYDSFEDCLCDYCNFMHDARYSVGGEYKYRDVLSMTDPEQVITEVMNRGYCTDPNYANSIMAIIRKHNLTQYDLTKGSVASMHDIIDITSENSAPRSRGSNPIEWIVIHYLGVPNADNPYLYGGGYGGHYNVTRDGSIYKAVDPREGVVWHCGGGLQGSGGHAYYGICTNFNSIGIECGVCADTDAKDLDGDSDLWYFTTETQESCAWLVSQLMEEYNIDLDHVIRHYDVTGKICANPYVLNNKRKTSWTWDEFKARVAEYCGGNVSDNDETPDEELTDVQKIVKRGQQHSINFTGHKIKCDGVRGRETTRNMKRCLQHAANMDNWSDVCDNGELEVDGLIGSQTNLAFNDKHYIMYGETQFVVTAVEIICNCLGRETAVEHPGTYGDGLTESLGGVKYLSASDILKLLE